MFEGMEPVEFEHEGTLLRGYAALPSGAKPAPAVLVMHSALGISHQVNESTAQKLADAGDVAVLRQELSDAGATYRITTFGAAGHGFTDPEAGNLELEGVYYDELSNALSWDGTLVLLRHLFDR